MKTKEQLEAEIAPLQAALYKLRDAEASKEAQALVGKFFKYRNSYGGGSPGWWMYAKVTHVKNTSAISFRFQTCEHDKLEIETSRHFLSSSWTPIKESEFLREWRKVQKRIAGMKP
jgi:ribosomal protein L35AE/L33A